MGRVEEHLTQLREGGRCALIPFLTAGYPDLATSEALLLGLLDAGADALEIGVPFSDPIGDGPNIQRTSEQALAKGTTLRRVLELVKGLRSKTDKPLILMGYANPFLAMGAANFAAAAADVGVDGLITIDLPPEEGGAFFSEVRKQNIDPILLATPTTTPERLAMLGQQARGFLYYVSVTGVTGARAKLSENLEAEVRRAKEVSRAPVCVGFGISTPEQARDVARFADGIAVGSALIGKIEGAADANAAVDAAAGFLETLRAGLP